MGSASSHFVPEPSECSTVAGDLEVVVVASEFPYERLMPLGDWTVLDEWEKADFLAVLEGSASEAVYRRSLWRLTGILHRVHGERVVVLIDEYTRRSCTRREPGTYMRWSWRSMGSGCGWRRPIRPRR